MISKFRKKKLTDDEIYDMQENLAFIIPDEIDMALYNAVPHE